MDAHAFRLIGSLLCRHLAGGRIERIYAPLPDVTTISFFANGEKCCLILRAHRSRPLLFLTERSPFANPAFPPALTMRLRKYAEGRIVGPGRLAWPERQLAFPLPGPETREAAWLLLDLRDGPSICTTLPEGFGKEPAWPLPEEAKSLCSDGDDPTAPWRAFTILTPPLRQALLQLDDRDAVALMVDLESGDGELFWYSGGGKPGRVSAWPQTAASGQQEQVTPVTAAAVFPPLAALCLPSLLAEAKIQTDAPAQKQEHSATRRHKRLLATLAAEKMRLEAMLALGDDARLLQAELWRLSPDARADQLTLPLDTAVPDGTTRTIPLNPFISVTENMQVMFRKAAKATRGLAMLEKRMAMTRETPPVSGASLPASPDAARTGSTKDARAASRIQEFISSDGFTLWRGRDAQGNKDALKRARPHDLWFHVEDGPSAHLIVRRDHAAQDVPETTLREAAVLTALKSWRKLDPKAPVMIALAKHVQPVKGAQAGTVRVHTVMRTILVDLDHSLEHSLRMPGTAPPPKRETP